MKALFGRKFLEQKNLKEAALFEHKFWLQILGDHSRFIMNSLSQEEISYIKEAQSFIILFDALLEKSHKPLAVDELSAFNQEIYEAVIKIRNFKLTILKHQIEDKIAISLPPTFINHMLNELDEYLGILNFLLNKRTPQTNAFCLHLLWLSDGTGHAETLASDLDMSQKELIHVSQTYAKRFTNLYLRTIEFTGYTRTNIYDFPALNELNKDANDTMTGFKKLLIDLEEAILAKKVLGTLMPLTLDHMFREECYYLTKLSMVSEIKSPNCDPTMPRIEL